VVDANEWLFPLSRVPNDGRCPWCGGESRLADSSHGLINSGSALTIGILSGVKLQPGDLIFSLTNYFTSVVDFVDLPLIEPGMMET
jgi:hypothetical protein